MEPILRKALHHRKVAAFLAILILFSFWATAQYNPTNGTVSNKPYAPSQAIPTDSRSYFYDATNFLWRPYQSTAEVLGYLNLAKYRTGNFIIVIDSGGTLLSNGSFINGHNTFWQFKDTTSNAGLVEMSLFGGGGCTGCLLAANNLSDLANAGTARSNLGLGTMSQEFIAASSTDITGNWPNTLVVNSIQGHNLAYLTNYANLTNTPPLVSLTTTGTSGLATYNSSTGVLNIPNYSGGGGSCLNCNADTIGNIPLNFVSFPNNSVLTLDSVTGTASWQPSSGGVATLPPNGGTGFRIYSPQLPAIRSLICNSGCTIDSISNTGALTFNVTAGGSGTVTLFTAGNLSPLFTTSVSNGTTTPALSFALSNASAYNIFGNNTASPATPFYFAPNISILNQWSGGTIALLGANNVWTGTNTFNGTVTIGAQIVLSANNTYNFGSNTGVAAHVWSRVFTSDAGVTLSSTTGSPVNISIGATPGITLLSTGQPQLNNYTTPTSFTGTPTSVLAVDVSGNIIQVPAILSIGAVQGLHVEGTTGDSVALGGFFYKADTVNTLGYGFAITNLPDEATLGAGDSVLVEKAGSKYLTLVPSSAIGGGGAVASVSNSDGTLTVSPTTGSVVASLNLANANTWITNPQTFNGGVALGSNVTISTTNTYSIGTLSHELSQVYTQNVSANGGLALSAGSTNNITLAYNGTGQYLLRYTGQPQFNAFTSTSAFTGGTTLGLFGFDASGNLYPIIVSTNLTLSGQTLTASGGGSASATGTSGGSLSSPFVFAISESLETPTSTTIPGTSGPSTFTWTFNKSIEYGDLSRAANQDVFYGPGFGTSSVSGIENTGFGNLGMANMTTAAYNSGFGAQVLASLTTGQQNAGFGWVTLNANTTGSFNTAVGPGAMSGNIKGNGNAAFGGIALDLADSGNYNTDLGYQAGGAQHGAPNQTVAIGAYAQSSTTNADTLTVHIGAYNNSNNTAALKNDIGIGAQQEQTYIATHNLDINIGNTTSLGFNKGSLLDYTNIGHSVLAWHDSTANFGTKSQIIMLGDSGVQHFSNLATFQAVGSGLVWVRDSAQYFEYNPIDALWEGILTTYHQTGGSGFANPMTTLGDMIVGGASGVATRVGIGTNTYVWTSNGTTAAWAAPPSATVAWNGITQATGIGQTWNAGYKMGLYFPSLAGDSAWVWNINNTTALTGQVGIAVYMQGANATGAQTSTAAYFGNVHSNGGTNIGVNINVSSASHVIALNTNSVSSSCFGCGVNLPNSQLDFEAPDAEMTIGGTLSATQAGFILRATNASSQATYGHLWVLPNNYGGTAGQALFSGNYVVRAEVANLALDVTQAKNIAFYTAGDANYRGQVDSIGNWQFETVAGKAVVNIGPGNYASSLGTQFVTIAGTSNNPITAASGTVTNMAANVIGIPTFSATNTGVTYTNAASLYISGSPVAGTNVSITNPYSLDVNAGNAYFGGTTLHAGNVDIGGASVPTTSQFTMEGNTSYFPTGINAIRLNTPSVISTNTDNATTGTSASNVYVYGFSGMVLAATNSGVTYPIASTVFINSPPTAGTNVTLTNAYSLYVNGNSFENGNLSAPGNSVVTFSHFVGNTAAPTIAAGSGAGSSPTISITGTDQDGIITLTAGTTPSTSATVATITYTLAFPTNTFPVLTAANSNAALLSGVTMVYTTGTTTNFTITSGTSALTSTIQYKWYYHCGAN